MTSSIACPPRFATPRNPDRATLGHEVETYSLMLTGSRFMPWQRLVTSVTKELDPRYDLDEARLWYRLVIIVVPRQSGKTTIWEADATWVTRRRPGQVALLGEQSLIKARERLLDKYVEERLGGLYGSPTMNRAFRSYPYNVRKSNGSEHVRWLDTKARNSTIKPIANTDDAGHGDTTDHCTIDEAFVHRDLTVINGVQPTMRTRPDPQLVIMSTIGDGNDGLLQHYQEVGEASLHDPGSQVAYFEWSALDDDDRTDPEVWRRVMPSLGYTLDPETVRHEVSTMTADEFDRASLCRRPKLAALAKLPAEHWSSCGVDLEDVNPTGSVVLGFAVAHDRSAASIAVAGRVTVDVDGEPSHRVGCAIERRPGTAWLPARVAELARGRGRTVVAVVADRRAGAGSLIDASTARGVNVTEIEAGDVSTHCGTFYDLVVDHLLAHGHQQELDDAAAAAVDRPLGDSWAWSAVRSEGPIDAITSSTWAVGEFMRQFPLGVERSRSV